METKESSRLPRGIATALAIRCRITAATRATFGGWGLGGGRRVGRVGRKGGRPRRLTPTNVPTQRGGGSKGRRVPHALRDSTYFVKRLFPRFVSTTKWLTTIKIHRFLFYLFISLFFIYRYIHQRKINRIYRDYDSLPLRTFSFLSFYFIFFFSSFYLLIYLVISSSSFFFLLFFLFNERTDLLNACNAYSARMSIIVVYMYACMYVVGSGYNRDVFGERRNYDKS